MVKVEKHVFHGSPKLFIVPLQLHIFVFLAVLSLSVLSLSPMNQRIEKRNVKVFSGDLLNK